LKKERKAKANERAERLECMLLKEKVDLVLAKGATPVECKWNNAGIKVMIQWYGQDGNKAMHRYSKTHTRVVDKDAYPHGDVDATVAGVAAVMTIVTITTVARSAFPSACCSAVTRSSVAVLYATAWSKSTQDDHHTFALAATGDPAASHAVPASVNTIVASTPDMTTAGAIITGAIIAAPFIAAGTVAPVTRASTNDGLPNAPPHAPPLDWGDTPFDVGIHLDLNAPAMPLCDMDSDDNHKTSSDDDSIFIDLS
jgi:hypothetical protein